MTNNQQGELPLFENAEHAVAAGAAPPALAPGREAESFSKYIVYVDESGDHGMETIDQHFPVFVLAFCVFHKGHYSEKVVSRLEEFKFRHFGHDQIVLHESDIRKERGSFRSFQNREQKQAFLDELTSLIDECNFIIISCVIDKQRLKDQQEKPPNPYHLALRYCLESLFKFLKEKGEECKRTHVVVEQRGKKEDNELELEFRRICDGHHISEENLPFEIIFSDKKAMSSGLQLADLVARPIGLSVFRSNQSNRAFKVLEKKFFCEGGREGAGTGYREWGLSILPESKSERPR